LQHGMDLKRALETYTVLTIGDGLVTVIPALVTSVSGGLIVTRTGSSESRLAETFRKQVLGDSQPLLLASGVLLLLAVLPGMPKLPFLLMGGGVGWIGWRMRQKVGAAAREVAAAEPHTPAKENLDLLLKVESLAVEVGLGLVGMVEGGANSPLLRRIAGIRKQLAGELGYMLPAVRVTDNLALGAREYDIRLKGVEIARFELKQGCELAIRPAGDSGAQAIEGTVTMEPAFGIPALWVRSEQAEKARSEGYTVVDASNVIGTHLMEIIRRHAHELFSRQDAKKFLDRVAEENPKIVEDLVPKLLSLAVVQRVLQNLLRERVSIRDAVSILEALGEAGNVTRNPVLLTEYVRQALGRGIVQPYLGPKGDLPAYFLDASVEQAIESSVEHGEHSSQMNLAPPKIREILDRVAKRVPNVDGPVVAVVSTGARYFLRQLLEPSFKNVFVLSHSEIPAGTKVTSLGLI